MKKIILSAFATLIIGFCYGQTDSLERPYAAGKPEGVFRANPNLRVLYIVPGGAGDNVISKAHKGNFGLGLKMNIFKLYGFHMGAGADFVQYRVTDASLAGNIQHTNITTPYFEVMYGIPVLQKITMFPKISAGYSTFHQKTGNKSYGRQQGPAFTLGTYIDYRLAKHFELFGGINYRIARPGVTAPPEIESFYRNIHQVHLSAGLKFNFRN